uniref:Uncharacterized protein n=1 Tax=Cacopsylla melanoneura TaxID=428564 RepID=A0A8D8ZCP1_9HEMI
MIEEDISFLCVGICYIIQGERRRHFISVCWNLLYYTGREKKAFHFCVLESVIHIILGERRRCFISACGAELFSILCYKYHNDRSKQIHTVIFFNQIWESNSFTSRLETYNTYRSIHYYTYNLQGVP